MLCFSKTYLQSNQLKCAPQECIIRTIILLMDQKYITRSFHLGNTSMTHQMYEGAIFRFAPSANLRARISNTASDWTNFKSILALNKKCARAIFHIRHSVGIKHGRCVIKVNGGKKSNVQSLFTSLENLLEVSRNKKLRI